MYSPRERTRLGGRKVLLFHEHDDSFSAGLRGGQEIVDGALDIFKWRSLGVDAVVGYKTRLDDCEADIEDPDTGLELDGKRRGRGLALGYRPSVESHADREQMSRVQETNVCPYVSCVPTISLV